MKFSAKTVDSFKARAVRYERYENSGLGVRVGTNGSRTWIWRYRTDDGKHRKFKLGTYPAMSLSEARQAQTTARVEVERGKDPAVNDRAARDAEKSAETVGGLWEFFQLHYVPRRTGKERLSERTKQDNIRIYERDIRPRWGRRKAKSITRREVSELVLVIKERAQGRGRVDATGYTANRVLSLVSIIFAFAVEHGLVDENPAAGLRGVVKAQPRERILSAEELSIVWRNLPRAPWALALKLALVTGQRMGAVLSAEWEEFDLEGRTWTVPATEGRKNKKPNPIPLSPLGMALLLHIRRQGEAPYLFPARTKGAKVPHLRVDSVNTAVARLSLDLERWTPHDLRRTALTGLRDLGVLEETAARIAGHAPDTVLGSVYDHSKQLGPKRAALNAWGAEIMRRVRGSRPGAT